MKNPVLTTVTGDSSDIFKEIMRLYVPAGHVLDMTYGEGVFWKQMDMSQYLLRKNDLDPRFGDYHDDCRKTRWQDAEFNAVILDPPYAGRGAGEGSIMAANYRNKEFKDSGIRTTKDMLRFYFDAMEEAHRVLMPSGILIVKCQDEINGGKQKRNHITIWGDAVRTLHFIDEDLFILHQSRTPIMRHDHQDHARKNSSFFWVFRKEGKK